MLYVRQAGSALRADSCPCKPATDFCCSATLHTGDTLYQRLAVADVKSVSY